MTIAITTRTAKGSELTFTEADDNFTNLKDGVETNDHIPVTVFAAYPVNTDNKVILADATAAAFQIDLPTAVNGSNMILYIKKIDVTANIVTISADGIELIDGVGSKSLTTQWETLRLISDGTAWYVL